MYLQLYPDNTENICIILQLQLKVDYRKYNRRQYYIPENFYYFFKFYYFKQNTIHVILN